MKVLLDECVPRQMRRYLATHSVSTVQEMGWSGSRNGQLLALAEANHFEVFVTADKNIAYQQAIRGRSLGLVQLPTNILPLLEGVASAFQDAVAKTRPGTSISITFPQL
jgi:predicted nuclease of predicted toxin-antitoxin system